MGEVEDVRGDRNDVIVFVKNEGKVCLSKAP